MIQISKCLILTFGAFVFFSGTIMLFKPNLAREILKKFGSTNLINYGEITMRMIVGIALIYYSEFSKFPSILNISGWFMSVTALILYFVPRNLHHAFSVKCAEIIKPIYFQIIAPFAFILGYSIIYMV